MSSPQRETRTSLRATGLLLALFGMGMKYEEACAFVRGEFKTPKSVRGVRGVPLAQDLEVALLRVLQVSRLGAKTISSSATRRPAIR
jgi:hypothetical protein